ncbi:Protein of unknown function [Bacillus wiedmannii]|uniref:Uncharacterized protein n=1 Tax=Bacillus wiedmannii TaxID=1890302 RepID=A0AB37YXJ5_9BACI|nr:Protein of unknown function [Bacillus wiedmannii]
MNQKDKERKE